LLPQSATAEAADTDGNGRVDFVQVDFVLAGGYPRRYGFGAPDGRDLEPGQYLHAQRYETPDRPYLDFSNSGVCIEFDGAFEILHAEFDTTGERPVVRSFVARMSVRCSDAPWPYFGIVAYEAPEVPQISGAVYASESATLRVYGQRIEMATQLVVDNAFVAFVVDGDGLKARRVRLDPGPHEIRVVGPDGSTTLPFTFDSRPAPFARSSLTVRSDPGEYIGHGERYRYKNATGMYLQAGTDDFEAPVYLSFVLPATGIGPWRLDFSSNQLSAPLAIGRYDDVERAAFASPGHAGMDVSSVGRGCNTIAGTFTIGDYLVETSRGLPKVRWVAVDFEQHCEGRPEALRGKLRYLGLETTILGATYSPQTRELRVRVKDLTEETVLYVDGQQLGPTTREADVLVLRNVDLTSGVHAIAAAILSGPGLGYSQPWILVRE
jgi:hypothetical protein